MLIFYIFIINVSSYWGEQGAAMESAYAASKGAVNAFTRSLEEELQPSGIRVHLVAPEFVDTEMNAHLSEEERLAAAAAMLLSLAACGGKSGGSGALSYSSDKNDVSFLWRQRCMKSHGTACRAPRGGEKRSARHLKLAEPV